MEKVVRPPLVTKNHVVAWERTGLTKKKLVHSAIVFDRATKAAVHQGTIPLDPSATRVDEVMSIGDDGVIIYRVHDNKAYDVTIWALRLRMPKLEPVGEPVKLGYFDFPHNGNPMVSAYSVELKRSPDGSKLAMLLHMRYAEKKEQTFGCWVMDAELKPIWEQVFSVPAPKGDVLMNDWLVTNGGDAVLALRTLSGKFSLHTHSWWITNEDQASQLVKVSAAGSTIVPVDAGKGLTLHEPCLAQNGEGFLLGGRLQAEKGRKTMKAGLLPLGMDLKASGALITADLTGFEEGQFTTSWIGVAGNKAWLIAKVDKNNKLVSFISEGGSLKMGKRVAFADPYGTLRLHLAESGPVGAYYDLPKNINALTAGQDNLRFVGSYLMEPALVRIDGSGAFKISRAVTSHDAERDWLKSLSHIGVDWIVNGMLPVQLYGKQLGVAVVESR